MPRSGWSHISHKVLPPVATVVLSAAILGSAVWIRHQEQTGIQPRNQSDPSGGQQSLSTYAIHPPTPSPSPSNPATSTDKTHGKGTGTTVQTNTTTHANPSESGQAGNSATSQPSSGPTPSGSANSGSGNPIAEKPSTGSGGDIGFSPVTGGTVQSLVTLPSASPSQSKVTEYGSHPMTTWKSKSIAGPHHTELVFPSNLQPSSLLALPLGQGVLWAVIPPTGITVSGTLGPSEATLVLNYTPFPASGKASLTGHAESLGSLPPYAASAVSSDPAQPPVFWYHPVATSGRNVSAGGSSSTTAGSLTSNTSSTSNTSNTLVAASNSTSTSPSNSVPSNAANNSTMTTSSSASDTSNATGSSTPSAGSAVVTSGTMLYLTGLYQTTGGAVVALRAEDSASSSTQVTWLYLWNETTQTLTPLCTLVNGGGTWSWFAVGSDLLYFGSRSTIPPSLEHFMGTQDAMNLHTLRTSRIRLGTWVSSAYTHANTLVFDMENSSSWSAFTPNASLTK